MKTSFILALTACTLSGCLFFYIPGSVVRSVADGLGGSFGNACIGEKAAVGDRVRKPGGQIGTVTKISGLSSWCSENSMPIRAEVIFD